MVARILPRPTVLSQPYWDGCREGVLRLQHCADCAQYQFYPRIICSHCGGTRLAWQASRGCGVIASFTIVRHGISAAYPAPYTVVLVDLQEGPRMMSSIVDAEPDQLCVGARVEAAFAEWSEGMVLPVFRLVDNAEGESL